MATSEQYLAELFSKLAAGEQATLLAFAEFLAGRSSSPAVAVSREPVTVPDPEFIERPPEESVVGGLKRLSKTYPMLDKSEMLSATSDMVATHIMQGTDATEAINELEKVFRKHYEMLKSGNGD
jgi:hypothetical protein